MLSQSTQRALFRRYSELETSLVRDPSSIEKQDVDLLVACLGRLSDQMPAPFLAGTIHWWHRLLLNIHPTDGENGRTRVESYEYMALKTFKLLGEIQCKRPRILGPVQRKQIRHAACQFNSEIWQAGMEVYKAAQTLALEKPAL